MSSWSVLSPSFDREEHTTPISEIPKPEALSPELGEFPFSMGEVTRTLEIVRGFPDSYVRQIDEMRERAREFSQRVIRPRALEIERKVFAEHDYFPWDVIEEACDYKLFSLLIPEAFGGGGFLSLHSAVMAEELAAGCGGLASTIGVHSGALSIGLISADAYLLGTEVQKVVAAEERRQPILWGGAVTEPTAGTDIWDEQLLAKSSARSWARAVDGGFLLNGRKCFISNGSVAREVVIAAALDRRDVAGSWTAFLVPADAPGFSVGHIERKMGQKSSPTSEVILEDVFVPRERLIGKEGAGGRYVSLYLSGSRGPVGAIGTGLARRALECLVEWAKSKRAGAGRLIDQQWMQLRIAELARDIYFARLAYMSSAIVVDHVFLKLLDRPLIRVAMNLIPGAFIRSSIGKKLLKGRYVTELMWQVLGEAAAADELAHIAALAGAAKILGSDTGVKVSGLAMRIMGHDAFDPRWPVEKCYRDAKLTQIYEGTNQANAMTQFKGMASSWDIPEERPSVESASRLPNPECRVVPKPAAREVA